MDARETIFVAEYLKHFNAARAARALGSEASSAIAARSLGSRMLKRPHIKAAIEAAVADRLQRAQIDADFVLREWLDIVQADINEIIEHRRGACRYCHGTGGLYQRTQGERDRDFQAFQRSPQALAEVFDEMGGIGYDATSEPNPTCIECFGEGEPRIHIHDTRDLSPGARALFAGIKQTKDGVEVKFHSKDKALEMIARYLGMLKDKVEVEGTIGLVERLAEGRRRTGGG